MTETVALLLAMVCLIGILALMVGAHRRPSIGSGERGPFLSLGSAGGFVPGLVATVALTHTPVGDFGSSSDVGALGAGLGVMFAILAVRALSPIRVWAFAIIGAVGTVGAVITFLTLDTSLAGSLWQRLVVLAALGGSVVATSMFSGRWGSWDRLRDEPLAIFGALEVLIFLSAPLGVQLSSTSAPTVGVLAATVGSALLGIMIKFSPGFVIGLAAFAIALSSVAVATYVYLPVNGPGHSIVLLLAYVASYVVTALVMKPFHAK